MAVDLWNKIQSVGTELTFRMMDLKLTHIEAEDLLEKLTDIAGVIAEMREEKKE